MSSGHLLLDEAIKLLLRMFLCDALLLRIVAYSANCPNVGVDRCFSRIFLGDTTSLAVVSGPSRDPHVLQDLLRITEVPTLAKQ